MNRKLWKRTLSNKNRLKNSLGLLRKQGSLLCQNGFILNFNRVNQKNVKKLYEFSLFYGVKFSNKKSYWNYQDNVVTTPKGIKFNIDMFDPLIFSETFLSDIHFSAFDLSNKIVIQAGGFIGDTALYYASRGAKVYSFEPDVNSYKLALENIKLNPDLSVNVIMKNYAIGSDEEIDFPVNPQGSGGSSAYYIKNGKAIKVKSLSVSSILKEFSITEPFLLDLDIKGNEFKVIMENCISSFKMVRIEYSTTIANMKIGTREEILKHLKSQGFKKIRIFKHNEGIYDLIDHGTIEAIK